MRAWRAAFHREPELSNEEVRTKAKVVRALEELGIRWRTYDDGFHGVLGLLGEGKAGPTVALRADMDGLPVTEATNLPIRSRVDGKMHACGHDIHMTCLLGAAALLKRREASLRGPVKLLFQPAEEQGNRGGALPFLEHGAFERPKVDFVVGQHVAPEIPVGSIGWRKGPLMAASDRVTITVRGRGGHAAFPHRGPDAVVVASEIVTGLQALVSRVRDPVDPAVVTIGSIHGGTRHNVLPEEVVLDGTVRTLRPETRDLFEASLRRRVTHIARSLNARARIRYERGYPVTRNDPATTERVVRLLGEEFGPERLREIENPVMGGEDMSRFLERAPGTFWFLGVGEPGRPVVPIHSPNFAPPERALVFGSAALAAAAVGLAGG
jgi:amidohydrolase